MASDGLDCGLPRPIRPHGSRGSRQGTPRVEPEVTEALAGHCDERFGLSTAATSRDSARPVTRETETRSTVGTAGSDTAQVVVAVARVTRPRFRAKNGQMRPAGAGTLVALFVARPQRSLFRGNRSTRFEHQVDCPPLNPWSSMWGWSECGEWWERGPSVFAGGPHFFACSGAKTAPLESSSPSTRLKHGETSCSGRHLNTPTRSEPPTGGVRTRDSTEEVGKTPRKSSSPTGKRARSLGRRAWSGGTSSGHSKHPFDHRPTPLLLRGARRNGGRKGGV